VLKYYAAGKAHWQDSRRVGRTALLLAKWDEDVDQLQAENIQLQHNMEYIIIVVRIGGVNPSPDCEQLSFCVYVSNPVDGRLHTSSTSLTTSFSSS
jgi:hypothetical protein